MSTSDLFPIESAYLLTELEVYNWGPFQGKHRAEIDRHGTAIIGPTGSGKTTLIDALMTLLAPQPKYNLASTGGHESDRDLISYVRGVSGAENVSGETDHIARPGKTATGISAKYYDGSNTVQIGVILWTEGASNAAQDLKRLWYFSEDPEQSLEILLTLHHEGGKRAITGHGKENVALRTFSSKKEYLARVRRFFEVGENAFSLLNRAAGLKQLNSIDQIFRELVLDDNSQFTRALEVAKEFDDLAGIHQELQIARKQRDSLIPVRSEQARLKKIETKRAELLHLRSLHPRYFASLSRDIWEKESTRLDSELKTIESALSAEEKNETSRKTELNTLKEQYLNLGGSAIESLEQTITATKKNRALIRPRAEEYQAFVTTHELGTELNEQNFQANQTSLASKESTLQKALDDSQDRAFEAQSHLRSTQEKASELEAELHRVKERPGSNIPSKFHLFRENLASELGCKVRDIPYVSELLEVKPEESAWRGAIERAIGSERLRLLIPEHLMHAALNAVNSRHQGIHVRLQSAEPSPRPAEFFSDGFTRKLNFREHPLRENLKSLLAQRDRHCVDNTEELHRTEHALTREGTMSGRDGRFEKQDQRPLAEGWMTGFDNKHQLTQLASQLLENQKNEKALSAAAKTTKNALHQLQHQLQILATFQKLTFEEIDLPSIDQELADLEQRLRNLTDPNSDTARAMEKFKATEKQLDEITEKIRSLFDQRGAARQSFKTAQLEHQRATEQAGDPLSTEDTALCKKPFTITVDPSPENLQTAREQSFKKLSRDIEASEDKRKDIQQKLVRSMVTAKQEDTGSLQETGTELRDIPDFLERLRVLEQEALPEKLARFRAYLEKSSGQGVTQLLNTIDSEVSIIEERIADLNRTLSLIDFRGNRYLQLDPQRTSHETLRSLDRARKRLTTAATRDDEGESHFKALKDLIHILRDCGENKDRLGSRALLDPRHRLQFYVVETDRETKASSGRRTGSQTGSGGEKEMMASYILTASLSYALCPTGATRPLYATIVLDEAFSKSSPAAAAKIILALNRFGLHPLFVTPNKEISLLKAHTKSAILVNNKNSRATLTSITWEQIDKARSQKVEGQEHAR